MSEELQQRVQRYRALTEQALKKVTIKAEPNSKDFARAKDFLSMARNYFNDARHFEEQKKLDLALAAYSYAHAWLDAGIRAGFLDGKQDNRLFTLL